MSELKRRKFNKIMDHRDQVEKSGTSAISNLNAAIDQAIDFSILLEEDPSGHFSANGDKEEIRQDFADAVSSLSEVLPKIELIRQIKDEEITIEQFKAALSKSDFNVAEYEKLLSK